ncbi:MAG: glycosyltransferase, partial [Gemmatimonadaceae bacterium]|nr:glycosyltransferase [Gloeobacterales cyanobacterium ES-bin-141]
NCTDDTPAVVARYIRQSRIPDLRIIVESVQGLTPARLCGVRHTEADWIAFVDDDCLLQEDWVARAAQFTQLHPDCGAFGGKVILEWQTPPPRYVLDFGYSFAEQDHGPLPLQPVCLAGAGLIVRRQALIDCDWMRMPLLRDRVGQQLVSGGDVEIVLRIVGAGYAIWYNPEMRLRHIIPPRRTAHQYLLSINHGLGTSQAYADSLVWPGSFPAWLSAAVLGNLRASRDLMVERVKTVLRRGYRERAAIEVTTAFVRGRWAGIGRMLVMNPEDRRALLGCARTRGVPVQK